jgi:predicted nucleic acid-binding protein
MKEEIKTHYIFLDTSIFIKENFFAGNKLKAFLKHEKDSEIELFTTKITEKECFSNLDSSLINSNFALKKALKELNSKAKSFKNIETLNSLFELNNTFDIEKEKRTLNEKFTKLLKDHFSEIKIDNNKTSKVVDDYFNFNAPFKDGKKKHEFPDALVLNSLESWCQENKQKIYVVADDEDMNSYKSKYLIPIKEYDKLLDQISFTFSDENITQKIEGIIEDNEVDIISKIEDEFVNDFPYSGFDESQGFEYETNDIKEFKANIDWHSVLQVSDNIATVELTIPVEYTAEISYEDKSLGWYDKEDDIWFGTEMQTKLITDKCKLIVIVEIEFELPGKEVYWKGWDFIEISSGIPRDISIDY